MPSCTCVYMFFPSRPARLRQVSLLEQEDTLARAYADALGELRGRALAAPGAPADACALFDTLCAPARRPA
jgi:hypothetical protein